MLELLDSACDTVAVRISGSIHGEDLDAVMDRLEAVMGDHDPVHIFVETHTITGIEISSLPGYVARAMPLLGRLAHFGRVAVVADQTWVRVGTRLESALLPHVTYRVFAPDERARALAWLEGRVGDE